MSTPKKKTITADQAQPEQIHEGNPSTNPSADPENIAFYIRHIGIALSCLNCISDHEDEIEHALFNSSGLDFETYYTALEMVVELAEKLHKVNFGSEHITARIMELVAADGVTNPLEREVNPFAIP